MKKSILSILAGTAVLIAAGSASAALVDGWEVGPPNPFTWADAGSPAGQTQNKAATAVISFVDSTTTPEAGHVTEGTKAGRFVVTWNTATPAVIGSHPAHFPGTATTFWSLRVNAAGGTSQQSIPHSATLTADIFNSTPDTYQFSYTLATGQGLKNLPFKTIAPGANSVSWDLSTLGPSGSMLNFTGSDTTLDGTSSKIRGLFFYTEVAPAGVSPVTMSMDIDNLSLITAQTDFTAPATPTILSVTQGAAAGELIVKWTANSEGDLAKYNVFTATNANFGSSITNRFSFPGTPAAVVNAPATQVTLTGIDTSQPVYVRMTAIDNATPSANESLPTMALGAMLDPTGGTPKDLVVLDYDRYLPSEANFAQNGYSHGIVYYAHALQTKNRTFVSANAEAVENGSVVMAADNTRIVYWSNSLDGEAVVGEGVNAAAQTKLTALVSGGGNLMISGTAIGEDLVTNATGPTFFSSVLMATLVNPTVGTASGENLTGNFPTVGAAFATGTDVFNVAGFTTTDNETYNAISPAVEALNYTANTGSSAAVLNANKTVLLGFGFESVRDVTTNPTTSFANARATRDNMLSDIINYLLAVPGTAATNWNMYE
ncbi:hypothetical protein BH09SUM1_BH09SUM1_01800 [soil metagenome]